MDDGQYADALTAVELRETALLAWGAVEARWTEEELVAVLEPYGPPQDLLDRLLDTALVVREPGGGYRSRFAETVRLLATLRQAFRNQRVTDGRPLVLDYRVLHRPRRRPERSVPASQLHAQLRPLLGPAGSAAAHRLLPPQVSGFQQRSARVVLEALRGGEASGVVVTAGTGSGKTLAFYLPLLAWLADHAGRTGNGTLVLSLYPRNELLKDQLRALLGYVLKLNRADSGLQALSVATWFGLTPPASSFVLNGQTDWVERRGDYVCPFLSCLTCGGDLLWRRADLTAGVERLCCGSATCGFGVDGSVLRLTRRSAVDSPADIMLTTTESINRQLAAPGNLAAFGVRPATLRAVLLDEVHTYEGTAGAQNAILLRRLRYALGRDPVWVGLSATLRNADEFFARLVGLRPGAVTVVQPEITELEESGAEYLLALRHDPHGETGTLSTSIQACMVLARCLDSPDDPADPPPSSDGVLGSKVFAFTDKLDSTNRFYWDLLDAEGWRWPGQSNNRVPMTLAHSRGENQRLLAAGIQEPAHDRDPNGQWWWLPDELGHGVEADRQLVVSRTSSQDRGVDGDAQVVVATATLEVGFDDDRVGAVLQHKAPHDAAQFLQRKGRAGRNLTMRPWTVVVLSDWGRDRHAWDAYDALFSPELAARNLPVENLYVLRIQAVYALLDWLAGELGYAGFDSTWTDLAAPPSVLHPDNDRQRQATQTRQDRLAEHLDRLLRPGPERERLRRYLARALGLGLGDAAMSVVDTLFWEAPRPLLLAVVPTMRRRLMDRWRGEEPASGASGVRTRTPLREFIPGNLFDDLLVPDVELQIPGLRGEVAVDHLSALRTLNEFCPGNVSRHFGIWASSKRHWIPLPPVEPGGTVHRIDVLATYRAELMDAVVVDGLGTPVYTPTGAALTAVTNPAVKDASSVRPEWEVQFTALGSGVPAGLRAGADQLLQTVTAHLHMQGGGVQVVRYARTARGAVWSPRPLRVHAEFGRRAENGTWVPAAIGVDVHCDALECVVRLPEQMLEPDPQERTARLRHVLEVEADLPDEVSALDRSTLADIVVLAVVAETFDSPDQLDGNRLASALAAAASDLGLVGAASGQQWSAWLTDPDVLTPVAEAVRETAVAVRSSAWAAWWRRRYTLSVAQVVLSALAALCPGVDVDDVLLDVDPLDDTRFYLSEPSPGGTGEIDAFHRMLVENPDMFGRMLEQTLRPSSMDTMDEELTQLLRCDSVTLSAALVALRRSWDQGHAAADRAVRAVDAAARAEGMVLGNAARTALSTRLAGPGAHEDLLDALRSWLDLRDRVMDRTGHAVDPRMLGGLLAHDASIDGVLHLGAAGSRQRRARAVANVLWPWGEAVNQTSANPYAPRLAASGRTVRAHVNIGPAVLDLVAWTDECRDRLHLALREHGELVVRAAVPDRAVLRAALLDLQMNPVEVGSLLCHPAVVGVDESTSGVQAQLLLREAL